MESLFNLEALQNGDILHVSSTGLYANAIRRVLGSKGSHDALIIKNRAGEVFAGEALVSGGQLTPIKDYEHKMNNAEASVAVLRMPGADTRDRLMAAAWFASHIVGTPYDFAAIVKLLFKAVFKDVADVVADSEWKWYCTESVRDAWTRPNMSANFDVWKKKLPTPRTTEKRVADGSLVDVSAKCLTPVGLAHRLLLDAPR